MANVDNSLQQALLFINNQKIIERSNCLPHYIEARKMINNQKIIESIKLIGDATYDGTNTH